MNSKNEKHNESAPSISEDLNKSKKVDIFQLFIKNQIQAYILQFHFFMRLSKIISIESN